MKTIDVLVEELPKRGGWPDGAIGAGFLSGEGTLYFWDKNNDCPPKLTIDTDIGVEVEDSDEGVSREQYEAALASKNEGWIDWGGGECPVNASEMVDVIFGYGGRMSTNIADCWRWNHSGTDSDIIAYRLHHQQEAVQNKEDDEADLKECIGQGVAPVWNGEGLPPVGCECEFMKHTLDAIPNWRRGIIKYVSEYTVVIVEALSPGEFVAHPRTCDFRPIRSEAERKRDAIISIIDKAYKECPHSEAVPHAIYEAIAEHIR
jgi:hypothetical protein